MKVTKQVLGLALIYLSHVCVSAASPQLTLGTTTGVAGQYVTVYGTGFWANTSGFVFFDHNYDYQQTIGSNWKCGALSEYDCEPYVAVTSDDAGNFITSLRIRRARK